MATTTTLDDVRETFELLDSWEDRYGFLIELGRALEPMPEALKVDQHKVEGCMSQVWMIGHAAEDEAGEQVLRFIADSDAMIVKGLIAVLLIVYSGRSAQAIVDVDITSIFDELGLQKHISVNRRNGFYAMVERIKGIAAATAANPA